MVTSGNYASYYLALLPSENGETIDNWVLPLGTQGLTFEADSWNGLGMRSNVSCFMRMTDMPLDRSWRVAWNSPLPNYMYAMATGAKMKAYYCAGLIHH